MSDIGHTHQPLPPAPLRSALKNRDSAHPTPTATPDLRSSRPTTPSGTISPASDSPYITRLPLPGSQSSPSALDGPVALPPLSSTRLRNSLPAAGSSGGLFSQSRQQVSNTPPGATVPPSPLPSLLGLPPSSSLPNPLSPTVSIAAQGYTPKVSFDTFENPVASMFSFTLQVKADGYKRTRSTRVFLCASSPDESGREALDWALESLVQDGDELIVCRGVDEDVLEKDHDIIREEAREFMRHIQEKAVETEPDRKLSLILEYVPGKITDTLDRLIALYRPDSVVVGTRGRSVWQNMSIPGMSGMGSIGVGSVSKYCLTHSPVPIIVVRPERKVRKAVEKRRADPKRGRHFDGDHTKPPPLSRPTTRSAPVSVSPPTVSSPVDGGD
ncbi:hypothetical protein EYR40_000180 [Pleurotus pulmonarius]|nr:hypothetical protein EYR36_001461 [Pleurotus pulmonarius]KAF4607844.1 hypothetical protein EYR40_000180 [Pleurotus pulmonarius]